MDEDSIATTPEGLNFFELGFQIPKNIRVELHTDSYLPPPSLGEEPPKFDSLHYVRTEANTKFTDRVE